MSLAEELPSVLDRLRRQAIFSVWPVALLKNLLSQSRIEEWENGGIIFAEQHPAADFFFLDQGIVELVSSNADGKEKIVEIMQRDDLFAEAVPFMGGRYPVTARCSGPTRILRIPFAPVLQVLDQDPLLMRRILAQLSMRLHFLVKELRQRSVQSADARVAGYLLELAQTASGGDGRIQLPNKKVAIAGRLGLAPETLSRVLRRFREEKLISVEGRSLRILDMASLQRWACA